LFKDKTAYIQELSVPFYDADIEFKSYLNKKELHNYKAAYIEFVPRKTGIQQEKFEFIAWGDKECKEKKLN